LLEEKPYKLPQKLYADAIGFGAVAVTDAPERRYGAPAQAIEVLSKIKFDDDGYFFRPTIPMWCACSAAIARLTGQQSERPA